MGSRMMERTATPLRLGDQRVAQFMQHHAAKDDAYQRHAAHGAAGTHRHRLREPDKRQQKQEGEVDADIDAEQSSRRN